MTFPERLAYIGIFSGLLGYVNYRGLLLIRQYLGDFTEEIEPGL